MLGIPTHTIFDPLEFQNHITNDKTLAIESTNYAALGKA